MMRMTYTSLCNFMKMLTGACYEALVAMAEGKRCHGGETEMVPRQHSENDATTAYPKIVPRQHIGSGNSIEIPMQERSVWMCATC